MLSVFLLVIFTRLFEGHCKYPVLVESLYVLQQASMHASQQSVYGNGAQQPQQPAQMQYGGAGGFDPYAQGEIIRIIYEHNHALARIYIWRAKKNMQSLSVCIGQYNLVSTT
jgi:hypothetical protein